MATGALSPLPLSRLSRVDCGSSSSSSRRFLRASVTMGTCVHCRDAARSRRGWAGSDTLPPVTWVSPVPTCTAATQHLHAGMAVLWSLYLSPLLHVLLFSSLIATVLINCPCAIGRHVAGIGSVPAVGYCHLAPAPKCFVSRFAVARYFLYAVQTPHNRAHFDAAVRVGVCGPPCLVRRLSRLVLSRVLGLRAPRPAAALGVVLMLALTSLPTQSQAACAAGRYSAAGDGNNACTLCPAGQSAAACEMAVACMLLASIPPEL
jgi:hypothetical protein